MRVRLDLSGNVPLYGQDKRNYCGPACAQMIMNGYPNPADRLFIPQGPPTVPAGLPNCWDTIQASNMCMEPVEWYTDPMGLVWCLLCLNPPPPPGSWDIVSKPDPEILMSEILSIMSDIKFPVATLINGGKTWVVIVGFETGVGLTPQGTKVSHLEFIKIYVSEPNNVGAAIWMRGPVWSSTYWKFPGNKPGSWAGNYVAIIEPRVTKGRVKVKETKRIGERIILPEEAIEKAKKAIDVLKLGEDPSYTILKRKEIKNLQPILVREEIEPGSEEKKVPYYYIVPFGFERETGESGVPLARISVIINAFTGQFEEITAFGKPVRYLPEKEAIDVVAKTLTPKRDEMEKLLAGKAKTAVVFQPSEITHIRAYPIWKITVNERVLYVDQLGNLFPKLKPAVGLGD